MLSPVISYLIQLQLFISAYRYRLRFLVKITLINVISSFSPLKFCTVNINTSGFCFLFEKKNIQWQLNMSVCGILCKRQTCIWFYEMIHTCNILLFQHCRVLRKMIRTVQRITDQQDSQTYNARWTNNDQTELV